MQVIEVCLTGLSYKSALDGWSSCVRLVRLSRLPEGCGIRKQYYRSYCCFFIRWTQCNLSEVARPRYATNNRGQRHQHPEEELYEPLRERLNCPDSIFNHFYVIDLKATEFGETTQNMRPLRHSRSFKVHPILHRFKVMTDY